MRDLFYNIIYYPTFNRLILKSIKLFNLISGTNYKIPPTGILKISSTDSNVFIIETNQTSFLTDVIYWNGIKSFEYSEIFLDLAKKINVFFDVGANIGYYSLLASTINKKLSVYAFEPASGPFHYLTKNIKHNNLAKNIKAYDLALSNSEKEIEFFEFRNPKYKNIKHNLGGTSSTKVFENKTNYKVKKVRATTLDNFVKSNKIEKIDLIKIDTEGTEHLILEKSSRTIEKLRPIIVCETLYNRIEDKLEKLMKNHGYEFYNHFNNKLIKTETIVRDKDDGVRDCFFVPSEKIHLISNYLI